MCRQPNTLSAKTFGILCASGRVRMCRIYHTSKTDEPQRRSFVASSSSSSALPLLWLWAQPHAQGGALPVRKPDTKGMQESNAAEQNERRGLWTSQQHQRISSGIEPHNTTATTRPRLRPGTSTPAPVLDSSRHLTWTHGRWHGGTNRTLYTYTDTVVHWYCRPPPSVIAGYTSYLRTYRWLRQRERRGQSSDQALLSS
jgi:hypothetical protein